MEYKWTVLSVTTVGIFMVALMRERRGIGAAFGSTLLNTSNVVSIPLALSLMTAVMPYDRLAVVVGASTLGNPQELLQLLDAIRYAFYAFAAVNVLAVIVSFLRGPREASRTKNE